MKIDIKAPAKKYLADKIPVGSQVILTTDDGSNNYSSIGATCELADKFQLIILNKPDKDFNEPLQNNAGYQMNILPFEDYLFGSGLNIDFSHDALVLSDNGGALDSALAVVDWRNVKPETEEQLRKKMQKIGDQIC
ncbi:iron-sulfur cluster biosynthesis family protein [Companilactobacillus halodurans]|uniref:Iron-sulfur cluster biosynthesis family protein n=1 Tax=Companilactobacillus halodurans TaxID=2584183 RepID=A0A5P1A0Z1_9LACO|nr:iron-sulfur cluster biosynthesis family protein [Companilactobacillus halodurans]MQS75199.1 iron-sulfur cluster biosynthesis family protein [Companilactobacillus halodurans]MQS98494.1 iron-sulfur cluster biosynthesis family protein [Companilactobacillus halodurans]